MAAINRNAEDFKVEILAESEIDKLQRAILVWQTDNPKALVIELEVKTLGGRLAAIIQYVPSREAKPKVTNTHLDDM